ncbi:hypothetical protein K2173_008381 [Erythroxylum novogranatense]|uniref:Pentatricopeptide repeat-containing protein n=1 Tax=Erythroxylum novogranatense TaxID=1862640 RepID=A0AAV8TIU2_9ROSI|nr:hypothetical protein K2173_008381 [Erythroxylum novogranatense]
MFMPPLLLLRGRPKPQLLINRLFFTTIATYVTDRSSIVSHYFNLLHTSPNPSHLRHLHARLLRLLLYDNVVLSSKLVLTYSHHNMLYPHALSLFFHMPHRNIFSWNIIIGEFSRSNFPEKALELFLLMWRESQVRPDDFSLPLVLRACAGSGCLSLGITFHGLCVKTGFEVSLFVGSALVFMYVTLGYVFHARLVFDEMPKRDAILWTAMLSGYAQHGEPGLGLQLFREMLNFEIKLDGVVMVSLLLMCGQLGWLKHGKSVHCWCLRNCLEMELSLGNAIVDMYVKCAILTYARRMFNKMRRRDVFSWSSLILGYGLGGNVDIALELFDRMEKAGVMPNDVTFLGVLTACAHGGLVERARSYFRMIQDCGLVAGLKHYATMVDCLGKAGLLEEAEKLIEEMPIEPDAGVLGAILSGCRVHNNLEVGGRIAKKLIKLAPEKASYYVLLSNIYAEAGRYEEAEKIRDFMKEIDVSKLPGQSLIESMG